MLIKKYGPFRLYESPERPWRKSYENFYWTLVARNGQVLATSEMYKTKRSAINGISSASKAVHSYNN